MTACPPTTSDEAKVFAARQSLTRTAATITLAGDVKNGQVLRFNDRITSLSVSVIISKRNPITYTHIRMYVCIRTYMM